MNRYRFVSSFYYPTESRPKAVHGQVPLDQPVQMSRTTSPRGIPQAGMAAQHAQMELVKAQQLKHVPPVVDHYFAPKPFIERPLIESSYCESGASYSMKHPVNVKVQSPTTATASAAEVENQYCPPVPPPSADLYNPEVAAVPQVQYPVHHYQQQQQVSNYPMVTYSSDPTLSPAKQMVDMQRHEVVREKTIPEVSEYSDYAWKRLDRKKRMQYAVDRNYAIEQEFPAAEVSTPFSATPLGQPNLGRQQAVEPPSPRYNNEEVVVQVQTQNEMKTLGSYVDSEYIGIPNDLYPAYRRQLPTYFVPEKAMVKQLPTYDIHNVAVAPTPRENLPPQHGAFAEDAQSDMEQCDTAQENPIFRSRFTTQVKTKDIPAPIRLPEVPRYTTQYSAVGNAFAPVGQPQISEYQYEDLNDLASCIDAI